MEPGAETERGNVVQHGKEIEPGTETEPGNVVQSDKAIEHDKEIETDTETGHGNVVQSDKEIEHRNTHRCYWQSYYTAESSTQPPTEPSNFAQYIESVHLNNPRFTESVEFMDIGCGNCRDSMYFAQKHPNFSVLAVDQVLNATDNAQKYKTLHQDI